MIDKSNDGISTPAEASPEKGDAASLTDMLKALTETDFLNFGAGQVAYVRPMMLNDREAYAVCGADGRGLSVHLTEGAAIAASKASDLRLMRIH